MIACVDDVAESNEDDESTRSSNPLYELMWELATISSKE
jgi:hypothetical protein